MLGATSRTFGRSWTGVGRHETLESGYCMCFNDGILMHPWNELG